MYKLIYGPLTSSITLVKTGDISAQIAKSKPEHPYSVQDSLPTCVSKEFIYIKRQSSYNEIITLLINIFKLYSLSYNGFQKVNISDNIIVANKYLATVRNKCFEVHMDKDINPVPVIFQRNKEYTLQDH